MVFKENRWFYLKTKKTVNLVYEMVELAAKALGDEADIEIIDMHDRTKADSPSGFSNSTMKPNTRPTMP